MMSGGKMLKEKNPQTLRSYSKAQIQARRGSRKRPDRRGLEPAAGTCHDATGVKRHDRHDSYQKTARLAAWFGVHRCTETKKAPGVPGLEVTKHLEGEL